MVQQVTRAVSKIRISSQKYEGTQKKIVAEAILWNIKGVCVLGGDVEEMEENGI